MLKRKAFLTNDPAQTKFLVLLLVSMLLPALFVGSFLYFLIFKILTASKAPESSLAYDVYPVMVGTNLAMILGFAILFLALFIWGVVVTHRYAGPLKRLQNEVETMLEAGEFKAPLSVRKKDYLRPLVDSMNKLLLMISEKAGK